MSYEFRQDFAKGTAPVDASRRCSWHRREALLAIGMSVLGVPAAQAQPWPAKPVRVLVGSTAGSPVDAPTRALMQRLSARYGQQFIIENRAGAGGVIAANVVAKAAPDGYTLLSCGPAEIINNYYIWKNSGQPFPYDPAKEFVPIAMIQRGPGVLVVSAKLRVSNWAELLLYLQAHPDRATIGVMQIGATTHLASELLKREAGLNLTVVPYKGSVDMHADLREARLTMVLSTPFETIEFVRRGELNALAVSHVRRIEGFETVPTFRELGLSKVINLPFLVLSGPAGMPEAVVQSLNGAVIEEIAGSPPVKPALTPFGREAPPMSPNELAAYIVEERARWARVIQDANVRI